MEPIFKEYMERYNSHIFMSMGYYLIVGMPLEKTIIKKNKCDSMEVIDILDKFDIHTKVYDFPWIDISLRYKRGDVIEKDIKFFDNYEDAFYSDIDIMFAGNEYDEITNMATGNIVFYWDSFVFDQCDACVEAWEKFSGDEYMDLDKIIKLRESDFHHYKSKIYKKIPSWMNRLICEDYISHDLDILTIPNHITHLTLPYDYNKKINYPSSLTHIVFGNCFNKEIDNLPDSVTHIVFGTCFNKDINNLPDSVTHISLGDKFNKKITRYPPNLTQINFGSKYINIDDLPNTVTHVSFKKLYDISSLPNSVTHLKMLVDKDKFFDSDIIYFETLRNMTIIFWNFSDYECSFENNRIVIGEEYD